MARSSRRSWTVTLPVVSIVRSRELIRILTFSSGTISSPLSLIVPAETFVAGLPTAPSRQPPVASMSTAAKELSVHVSATAGSAGPHRRAAAEAGLARSAAAAVADDEHLEGAACDCWGGAGTTAKPPLVRLSIAGSSRRSVGNLQDEVGALLRRR